MTGTGFQSFGDVINTLPATDKPEFFVVVGAR